MRRPPLPAHLSYKSALVISPPVILLPPIESIREKHDRNFHRWPPHINLIYPFLSEPSQSFDTGNEEASISRRLRRALQQTTPLNLRVQSTGHFRHSKANATVWLRPDVADENSSLLELQACLRREFAECDGDKRPFVPHLSLGQTAGNQSEFLEDEVSKVMQAAFEQTRPAEGANVGVAETRWTFDWMVDRVYVIERQGFKDRFKVIGEVRLGEE